MIDSQKHRTVGVSMHPDLEKRAKAQASSLGLKFSPYVTLCIEAEMRGMAQILNTSQSMEEIPLTRARNYMESKTTSADFHHSIETILNEFPFEYTCNLHMETLLCDFAIHTSSGIIALESCPYMHNHYALALGQGILLKSSPKIAEVILITPYLSGLNPEVKKQIDSFNIKISTPDILNHTLKTLIAIIA